MWAMWTTLPGNVTRMHMHAVARNAAHNRFCSCTRAGHKPVLFHLIFLDKPYRVVLYHFVKVDSLLVSSNGICLLHVWKSTFLLWNYFYLLCSGLRFQFRRNGRCGVALYKARPSLSCHPSSQNNSTYTRFGSSGVAGPLSGTVLFILDFDWLSCACWVCTTIKASTFNFLGYA